jgi:hypothetical protein
MIYSPARRRAPTIGDRQITSERPQRCVLFNESEDHPAVREWLDRMPVVVRLRTVKVFKIPVTVGEGKTVVETWRVFEIVPRDDVPGPVFAGAPAESLRR